MVIYVSSWNLSSSSVLLFLDSFSHHLIPLPSHLTLPLLLPTPNIRSFYSSPSPWLQSLISRKHWKLLGYYLDPQYRVGPQWNCQVGQCFLNLSMNWNHLERLLKHILLGPHPRVPSSAFLRWSLKMCINTEFWSKADSTDVGTILWEPVICLLSLNVSLNHTKSLVGASWPHIRVSAKSGLSWLCL